MTRLVEGEASLTDMCKVAKHDGMGPCLLYYYQ